MPPTYSLQQAVENGYATLAQTRQAKLAYPFFGGQCNELVEGNRTHLPQNPLWRHDRRRSGAETREVLSEIRNRVSEDRDPVPDDRDGLTEIRDALTAISDRLSEIRAAVTAIRETARKF